MSVSTSSYWHIEAEFPSLAEVRPAFSAAWYARWRDLHLAKYPDVEQATKDNLDMFVHQAAETVA